MHKKLGGEKKVSEADFLASCAGDKKRGTMRITVTLNGSNDNPWHGIGLNANPFPQIARAEFAGANRMLRELDSEPLKSADDIRRILNGCDQAFIDLCVQQFKPGERIAFQVEWPE